MGWNRMRWDEIPWFPILLNHAQISGPKPDPNFNPDPNPNPNPDTSGPKLPKMVTNMKTVMSATKVITCTGVGVRVSKFLSDNPGIELVGLGLGSGH